jgi:3-hydroxybutyryl-CoA dehydratase
VRSVVRLAVGATVERMLPPLTRADIARFAGAGGDFNPLHLDDEVARAAGFDGVIAMGQLQAAAVAGALSDWVGVERVRAFAVRFRAPLTLGDALGIRGTVESIDGDLASVELAGTVGDRLVITATARVRMP